MPLNTRIIRNGEALSLRWGSFHVAAMVLAASFDAGDNKLDSPTKIYDVDSALFDCYPDAPFPIQPSIVFILESYPVIGASPLGDGSYILKNKQSFRDTTDGEIFTLFPGDELIAYRGW